MNKNPKKPSCIDLILKNCPCSFQNSCVIEIYLSDFHKMVTTVMITTFRKMKRKVIKNCNFKHFWNNTFRESLQIFFSQNQGPRQDSGSAGTKKVLDTLENDTKANFQENIHGKVRFQKKWEGNGHYYLKELFLMKK